MHRQQWIAQQHGRKAVLYVVKLYGNGAEAPFYKIGITFDLSQRFRTLRFAGYKWRTVARYSSYNAGKVYDLEARLHREFAGLSYAPLLAFGGKSECYGEVGPLLAALPTGAFFLKNTNTLI
jgi:hypothetical protein